MYVDSIVASFHNIPHILLYIIFAYTKPHVLSWYIILSNDNWIVYESYHKCIDTVVITWNAFPVIKYNDFLLYFMLIHSS